MWTNVNILAAWLGVLLGIVSGAVVGIWFHREDWLGGYASWPRRMMRLGHISFFGIAMLNVAYATTVHYLHWSDPPALACVALASANFLMPAVCSLAAWRPVFRHLFFVPVSCVLAGVLGILIWSVAP
jgi:hypothetical protein